MNSFVEVSARYGLFGADVPISLIYTFVMRKKREKKTRTGRGKIELPCPRNKLFQFYMHSFARVWPKAASKNESLFHEKHPHTHPPTSRPAHTIKF